MQVASHGVAHLLNNICRYTNLPGSFFVVANGDEGDVEKRKSLPSLCNA